jgi:hypothetical protein
MPDGKHTIPTQGQDANNVDLIFVITAVVIVVAALFGVLVVIGARVAITVTVASVVRAGSRHCDVIALGEHTAHLRVIARPEHVLEEKEK